MMADFVTPRHSAVMERLRRRIELFRQHHNNCGRRYDSATLERLELERQQTFALHQRCLQAKAKRSNKHRQPPAAGEQAGQRAPGGGGGAGGGGTGGGGGVDLGDGGAAPEQSRNSTLIALQETVKRKLESAGSPLGRDQVNGFSDGFPPSKKVCMDSTANGSPMDSKLGIGDSLKTNGTHGPAGESLDGNKEVASEFQRKEMKQEPDDILPIMPPSGAGGNNNSLLPDLNLNEQEWTELMEELNRTVAYEDIQDILNDGFEDRKDPLEMTPNPGSNGGAGGGGGGSGSGAQSSQSLLSLDLGSVKAEFSPASSAFDQDSHTGSPHVRSTSSGPPPPHPTSSPVATSTASSPAVPPSQQAPPPRQHQPPPNHLLPPGPSVPKDLSPAQQLQQLAAQQQRAQHLHSQLQHKQPQAGAKFHSQGPHAHPSSWTQMAKPSQSPLGGAFSMDKPTSPSLYPQDFNSNTQKQLLMSGQTTKVSPKAGANSYMPVGGGHPNMLGHPAQGPPLTHPPAPGPQAQAAMLNYNNTKPLSHFEAGPGLPRAPINQNQNKAALLSLLRQQQQQQMKQKTNMNFRQHLTHSQDQNSYPAPPQGPNPTNTMTSTPGNGMAAQPGAGTMAGNHGNPAYLSSQAAVAAALKQQQHQQQILEQQKQQQYLQRQQLMAEQEKQRQQDQQLQRHLTRPPPQYQDQQGQQANQNAFQQPPVSQFTVSSQPMASVASMGGPAPGPQRMFPQNQSMMTMNMAQSGGPAGGVPPPPAANQTDISLPSCGGGGAGVDVQQVLYNNMNLHTGHPPQQRPPMGSMSAPYRQNLLAQQQHLKAQPNAALLKQQQQLAAAARMPGSMQASVGANMATPMPGAMQGTQNAVWQQQLANQPPSSNAGLPPNAFTNPPNTFHMQQSHIPKMAPGTAAFSANPGGRPMGAMMQTNMQVAQQRAAPNPQNLGQPMANQQQAGQNQNVLPDLVAFGPTQSNGRQGLPCNQGYQVSRTANQQQLSFGYNAASGSFAAESDLVDSLLKSQSTQEWMADLDELLASHH